MKIESPRILLVTPEFSPKVGGIACSAARLASSWAEMGYPTTVLTYDRTAISDVAPYSRIEEARPKGPRILRVGPIPIKFTGTPPEEKARFRRQFVEQALRTFGAEGFPDLVISLGLVDAGFVGLCIAQALGRPHIASGRGADVATEIFQGEKFPLAHWVICRSSAVTFVNKYLMELAQIVFGPSPRFRMIHNGVTHPAPISSSERENLRGMIRRRLGIPASSPVIGWVGTFRTKKGIRYLDEAFQSLVATGKEGHLLIVGGPRSEDERLQCPSLDHPQLSKFTHCTGLLTDSRDVMPYYFAMDVFAYPSLDDGMPNAVLEAMAANVPIVTTDILGDIVEDGKTALLVPRFDSEALFTAITQLLDRPEMARQIAAEAYRVVQDRFPSYRETEAYLTLFDEVMVGNSWKSQPVSPSA